MAVRIGTNPIGWSNDDFHELGGNTPLEVSLEQARDAGFEGIELGYKFPREAGALRAVLSRFKLDLVSGWHSMGLLEHDVNREWQTLAAHKNLLKALGAGVVIVAETSNAIHGHRNVPLSRRPRLPSEEWPRFAKRLTTLAERLAGEGLRLVYHHHMGTVVESGEDVHRLMEMTGDAVHLLLDTGHLTFAGADPAWFARTYSRRISHVHAKDVRAGVLAMVKAQDKSFLDAVIDGVYTVPGDGMVDFAAVFASLGGYSGWVVVEAEQDPQKANPRSYAIMGFHNVQRLLRQAGLL
jgi:inosose dehydratase/3D-(3,5/4)-trihydroxycyclohexane-1,2-dione acylhydrolase (decyclizing)